MNEIYSLTIKEYISIMNKQVYYLLSQDYYSSDDVQNKTNYLSEIREKDAEIIKIDTEEITNIFEVIKNEEERNAYTIIYIHKQDRSVFKVGNVIYLDFGMVSFYTKDINGKTDKIEVLPTSYLIINNENNSSVLSISNTSPIPKGKAKEALKHALAGELQGKKITFLDAGSGSSSTIPLSTVVLIKNYTSNPIIIGGGINKISQIEKLASVGTNVIVIGNAIEKDSLFLDKINQFIQSRN